MMQGVPESVVSLLKNTVLRLFPGGAGGNQASLDC